MTRLILSSFVLLLCLSFSFALDNGLGLIPPRGWNTWCTDGVCGDDICNEEEVRSVAEALVSSGLADLGYTYVNLDDCWADHRDQNGNIVADATRFPNGMKALADYIHSLGLKFGLYTDAGEFTCSQGHRDHKIPGSYGHYAQDAQTYASWGMDYVKMDWCNTKVNGTQLRPEIQYAEMSRALNQTGRPIFFESCEWGTDSPWQWMRAYANAWRATGDHLDNWASTAIIIEEAAQNIAQYSGPGGWNYLDFLMTGGAGCADRTPLAHCPGMTDIEYKTEFSIWVTVASPLIVATDIRNMTGIMKQVLFNQEMLDIHQDRLGRAGSRVGNWNCSEGSPFCQIWARPLFDGSYLITLYNLGSLSHNITVDFSLIGWGNNLTISLRDLWEHQELGTFTNSYTANVVSHGVVCVKATLQMV